MVSLLTYVKDGMISDVSLVRLPNGEDTPSPRNDEAVVFADYFKFGLRLPCDDMVAEVLKIFKVYLHQLTPSAILRLSVFAWATRSEGAKASAKAFAAVHKLHRPSKPVFVLNVQSEAQYGCFNFVYRSGVLTPVVTFAFPTFEGLDIGLVLP